MQSLSGRLRRGSSRDSEIFPSSTDLNLVRSPSCCRSHVGLRLDGSKLFAKAHHGSITWLDLDRCEQRWGRRDCVGSMLTPPSPPAGTCCPRPQMARSRCLTRSKILPWRRLRTRTPRRPAALPGAKRSSGRWPSSHVAVMLTSSGLLPRTKAAPLARPRAIGSWFRRCLGTPSTQDCLYPGLTIRRYGFGMPTGDLLFQIL